MDLKPGTSVHTLLETLCMAERCMLNSIEARVESACFQELKLTSDNPLP
jgi:hypothetical protein